MKKAFFMLLAIFPFYMVRAVLDGDQPADRDVAHAKSLKSPVNTDPDISAPRRKMILHLGAHKTRTTWIQKWLNSTQEDIKRGDYAFVSSKDLSQMGVYGSLNSFFDPSISETKKQTLFQKSKSKFEELLNENKKIKNLLVSDECIMGLTKYMRFGWIYPYMRERISLFKELVADIFDISVIFYIRDMPSFVESCYLQQIHHGVDLSFTDFTKNFMKNPRGWAETIGILRDVFGEQVKIVEYNSAETSEQSLLSFWRHVQSFDPQNLSNIELPFIEEDPNQINLSLSAEGVQLCLDYYASTPDLNKRKTFMGQVRAKHNIKTPGDTRFKGFTKAQREWILSNQTRIYEGSPIEKEQKDSLRAYFESERLKKIAASLAASKSSTLSPPSLAPVSKASLKTTQKETVKPGNPLEKSKKPVEGKTQTKDKKLEKGPKPKDPMDPLKKNIKTDQATKNQSSKPLPIKLNQKRKPVNHNKMSIKKGKASKLAKGKNSKLTKTYSQNKRPTLSKSKSKPTPKIKRLPAANRKAIKTKG